jgi:hypothetical protein
MTSERLAACAELVLDPRLAEVWQLVWSGPDRGGDEPAEAVSEATLGALLRLSYVLGYADAMDEPEEAALFRELGIRSPKVRAKAKTRRPGGRPASRSSGR